MKKSSNVKCGLSQVSHWMIRLSLSFIFLLSGVLKAIDPKGTSYKIAEYLNAFQFHQIAQKENLVWISSIFLCIVEFVLGVYILLGIRRRFASLFNCFLAVAFALLSLYVWMSDAVSDCGCFGDAIVLTNAQTFIKAIVLLVLSVLYRFSWHKTDSLLLENMHWIVSLYSICFIAVLGIMSSRYLPMIDFRPYKIGVNISQAMEIPPNADLPVYENYFILSKNGKQQRFTLNNYPDSTWEFVRSENKLVKPGYEPLIKDFYVTDTLGNDVTHSLLNIEQYLFLLVFPHMEKSEDAYIDEINNVVDYCQQHGYMFAALTAASKKSIDEWQHYSGADYPVFTCDETLLKTMIRSNPGLILLKKGTILAKWSSNNLPAVDENTNMTALQQDADLSMFQFLKIILYYVIPLLFITFVTNLVRSYKINLNKNKMRKKIVAGNWKMNKNLQEGIALAKELTEVVKNPNCGVVICTPFIHLASVADVIKGSAIELGAENCADKASGAYTGEVSAEMVKSTGAQYVILGHSERRQYYNETPEILKEKVQLALANGLKVIFCIGETLEEREANKQNEVVKAELAGSVYNLSAEEFKNIVIAYEPIWAIGTGKTATAEQAEEIHAYIRSTIAEVYGQAVADETTILYGGSCKASNAPELFAKPDIDGGLIGGASLKAPDFKGIIDAWN